MAKGEKFARQQAAKDDARFNDAVAQNSGPTPAEQREEARQQAWESWWAAKRYDTASPGGPILLSKQAREALNARFIDRAGVGLSQAASAAGASPSLLAVNRERRALQASENQALSYGQALNEHNAQMQNRTLPLAQLGTQRNQFLLDMFSQRAQQSSAALQQRLSQPSPLWGVAAAGVGAAGAALSGGFSGAGAWGGSAGRGLSTGTQRSNAAFGRPAAFPRF